jgi:hypothetical protein
MFESQISPVILVVHFIAIFLHDYLKLISDPFIVWLFLEFQFL